VRSRTMVIARLQSGRWR